MKKGAFKQTLDRLLEHAKTLLLKDGKLMPIAFVHHENDIDILGLSFRDKEQKEEQFSILKRFVKLKRANAIFIVVESWYVTVEKENLTIEPAKDPMRKECILVFGEYENGSLTVVQLFGRKDEKIIFEEKLYLEDSISGKFDFGIKNRNKNFSSVRNLN